MHRGVSLGIPPLEAVLVLHRPDDYFLPPPSQVSIERLSKFLNAEEVAPYVQRINGVAPGSVSGAGGRIYPDDICIKIQDGTFFWTGKMHTLMKLWSHVFLLCRRVLSPVLVEHVSRGHGGMDRLSREMMLLHLMVPADCPSHNLRCSVIVLFSREVL